MRLEVCVDAFESVLTAKAAGADRVELCSALNIGGLTPSYGLLDQVRFVEELDKAVMIRPRSGNFVYSQKEIETMTYDVEWVKKLGYKEIVVGILTAEGYLDLAAMAYFVALAAPMKVVLHRAFDVAREPEKDIPHLIDMGIVRILTSGQQDTAIVGASYIRQIQEKFGQHITIMPGSGVNAECLPALMAQTGCGEYHMSGRLGRSSDKHVEDLVGYADYDTIRRVRLLGDSFFK